MIKKGIPVLILVALVLTSCNLGDLGGQLSEVATATLPAIQGDTEVLEDLATPTSVQVLAPTATEEEIPTEEPTVEPTEEPEPTSTPEPTPTEIPDTGDPAAINGDATWMEDFSGANISTFVQDEDWYSIGLVKDGTLEFTGKQSQIPGWRMAITGTSPLGVSYMEATIQNSVCNSGSDSSGLYFRVPNSHTPDQGYLFGITCGGHYYLWRWNGKTIPEGQMEALIPMTSSGLINLGTGAVNRMGVTTDNDGRMVMYINGVAVDEYTSSVFPTGYFGVFVRAASLNPFTVKVEQAAYWANPKVNEEQVGSGSGNTDNEDDKVVLDKYNFDYLISNPTEDPGIVLGAPTWRDHLNSSANWGAFKNEYLISTGNQNGELELIGLKTEAAWVLAATPKIGDGAIELVLQNNTCQMWDSSGIFFRTPDAEEGDRGYLFGVTCNGYYYLWLWDGKSDKMTKLIDYTKDIDTLNFGSGARNRLDVVLVGNTIQLYANSTYLTSYYDDTHLEGYFGVFIRPQYAEGFTVYLDEASYWINESAE